MVEVSTTLTINPIFVGNIISELVADLLTLYNYFVFKDLATQIVRRTMQAITGVVEIHLLVFERSLDSTFYT